MTEYIVCKKRETAGSEKPMGKTASRLDSFFKITERGSTLSREVWSGITSFLISAAVLFINVGVAGSALISADANEGYGYYAGLYLALTLVSLLGTIAVGLLANLPLSHSAALGLNTAILAMAAKGSGLTYENLLAVSLVSSAVFLAFSLSPLKKYVLEAMPKSVKRAIPTSVGAYLILTFLIKLAGADRFGSVWQALAAQDQLYLSSQQAAVTVGAVLVTLLAAILLHRFGKNYVLRRSIYLGMIVYYFFGCIFCLPLTVGQDRLFLLWDPYGSYNIGTAAANFARYNLLAVFRSGFDFSAYAAGGGSVPLLFAQGILMFLFMGIYGTVGHTSAAVRWTETDADTCGKILSVTAGANVLGALLGAVPVGISAGSEAAGEEGGRTGLSSVVTAIGYLISLFTWFVFAIMATNMGPTLYGHAEFNAYTKAMFHVLYAALIAVGLFLLRPAKEPSFSGAGEKVTFAATVLCSVLTANFVTGICAGIVCDAIGKLASGKKAKPAEMAIGVLSLLFCALTVVLLYN